jgi:fructose-1,6-bisphosphatase/inositol monophosphatase family enzyme
MEPTLDQLDAIANLLLEVADAEILPHFRKLPPDKVRTKSSAIDWVTVADEAAERVLRPRLLELFPTARIVGEEAVAQDEGLLDILGQPGLVILVDPIDGTRNFASGLSLFGVMVAFVSDGQLLASVICDPVCRDWAIARRGDGAWIRHSDGRKEMLRAATARPVEEMEGCGLWLYMPEAQRTNLAARLTTFASNSAYRCAAHEYRLIAGGH